VVALRRHLHTCLLLALCAAALLALAPTLSRMLAFAQGTSNWAEVCTPQGAKRVAVMEDGQLATQAVDHLAHCPLCALSSAPTAPPPCPVEVLAVLPELLLLPPLFWHGPRGQHAWLTAAPRGPPRLS
jgi:Protein of unknown function (DUF2946)